MSSYLSTKWKIRKNDSHTQQLHLCTTLSIQTLFWVLVEALHVAVHIQNILLCTAIENQTSFFKIFNNAPRYDHLRVSGCLCFPNINHSKLSKLSPRSTPSLFLGYPAQNKGYRCLDLKTNKIIFSRHVFFDENVFLAAVK